jgi:hypothetical protein
MYDSDTARGLSWTTCEAQSALRVASLNVFNTFAACVSYPGDWPQDPFRMSNGEISKDSEDGLAYALRIYSDATSSLPPVMSTAKEITS